MKSDNIEKIRRACIAANPGILDLKFGCLVEVESDEGNKSSHRVTDVGFNKSNSKVPYEIYFGSMRYIPTSAADGHWNNGRTGGWKILGRDLQLADVLLVEEKILTEAGVFTKSSYYEAFGQIAERWDLKKPLHEQSDETILFIAGLLK